ncbi:hypothetical protein M406DRAFT_355181 [Cryphonectria parasitica EP155]|uniref:Uncharacterized protein n=1 Tax=Cryphonectria parasitica (strain ATCC 38755 / EP155) TaxID=660469 RepID=A0A9P4Y8W6_CRYP1|nr:uncharacterized protein M406DRAFT_355181 [Cryphonectria parasitica EP155]KAF3769132.1 hypothetical protein M406DRAFT_355181 [Cryphonectria parasitica EP155]
MHAGKRQERSPSIENKAIAKARKRGALCKLEGTFRARAYKFVRKEIRLATPSH